MPVMAERVGHRVYVRAPFKYKDALKGVTGARWSPKARAWTYPLDIEVMRELREVFGDKLQLGDELTAWGREMRKQEDALDSLSNVKDIDVMAQVELPTVAAQAPTLWAAMLDRPYQPVAALYMATARQCLNGDQPGLGKTIETLAAMIEAGVNGPVLVLAPRTSCKVVWEPEIKRWFGDEVPHTVHQTAGLTPVQREKAWEDFSMSMHPELGTFAGTPEYDRAIHFLIANAEQVGIKKFTECPAGICDGDEDWCPEFAQHRNASETRRPFLHSITWSAIIADETHKWLINTRGKQASQVGYGFTKLRTVDDAPRWALTGTPLKGKKHNLFGTLNWLRPKVYTSKWRWIGQWFDVKTETKDIGRRGEIEVKEIGGLTEAKQEKFYRSMRSVMIRRTKAELRAINPAWAPPEKRYHDVWVEMEPAQRRHYLAMEKDAEVELDQGTLSATGILAVMTRLRQFANSDGDLINGTFAPKMPSAKFDWLVQFLEERGIEAVDPRSKAKVGDLSDDVQKVVVASQFTQQIHAWAAELVGKGIQCYVLTGETKDSDRERYVNAFQSSDDVRVFMINTNAGGVSITLDAADDIVIMDETWVPDDQEQVEDRVHRASNVEHQVDVWYVRTKGTVEEGLASVNADKAKSNHVVLDAQRGLRFAAERFGSVAADHAKWSAKQKKKGKGK